MEPQFVHFDDVRAFELAAGVIGRPLFGEGAMLNLIEFEPGATVPLHSHEHEQLGIILRGMQALVVTGKRMSSARSRAMSFPAASSTPRTAGPRARSSRRLPAGARGLPRALAGDRTELSAGYAGAAAPIASSTAAQVVTVETFWSAN